MGARKSAKSAIMWRSGPLNNGVSVILRHETEGFAHVILSGAKNLPRRTEILRSAQNDMPGKDMPGKDSPDDLI
jgi:hypothetical protein